MTKYIVEREDATNLGGPMGTEYTIPMKSKLFNSFEAAERYCQEHSNWDREKKWKLNETRDVGSMLLCIRKAKRGWV